MDETDFEGTLVLEQLAAIDEVEEFFDAIDADDVERATALMRKAGVDAPTIATVVRKMHEGDAEH
jgi:DNA-binding GntR family transcriptional regulator